MNLFLKSNPVKFLSHFSVTLLVLVGLVACSEAPAPAPAAPQPILQGNQLRFPAGHPQLSLLTLTAAVPAKEITLEMPGKLVWNEEKTQRIYPAFAGRVSQIHVDLGQPVKVGLPLVSLLSPDFGTAQADTAKAKTDEALAQKTLQRQTELFEAGIIARKELEQAQADVERARSERDRATARTQLYGGSQVVNQQLSVRSTLNGTVVERNVNPGQELRPDQSGPGVPPLFVVSDPSSLWVQIDMRESEAGVLKVGSNFSLVVPALAGQQFEGKVIAVADAIDPNSRTIKVRGSVNNAQRLLKAEMLVTVKVSQQFSSGVVVPASAVILRGNQLFVMVQTQAGVFQPREVQRVHEGSREVIISTGLSAGELVVSENALLLGKQFRNASDEAKPGTGGKAGTE